LCSFVSCAGCVISVTVSCAHVVSLLIVFEASNFLLLIIQACSYPRPHISKCVEQVALSLNNLAALLRKMSKGEQAEKLYMRSLSIREEALGPDHPQVNPSRLLACFMSGCSMDFQRMA